MCRNSHEHVRLEIQPMKNQVTKITNFRMISRVSWKETGRIESEGNIHYSGESLGIFLVIDDLNTTYFYLAWARKFLVSLTSAK